MKYTKIALLYSINKQILALGAQSKSSFCFAKGNTAYLSESGGDLSDLKNFKKFERDIKRLQKKIKIKPSVITCDLHPEYISTKYAYDLVKSGPQTKSFTLVRGMEWRVKAVQHHKAHIASCMADNRIRGNAIGVAFDGTGFGSDGNMWGGEFFIGNIRGLNRIAHLKYIPMPGSEACIREPWRMAFSYLYSVYGKKGLPAMTDNKDILFQMIDKKINSPLTSSVGRLFDGVSALIGVCDYAGYEGEAAIKMEKMMWALGSRLKARGGYEFQYNNNNGVIIIGWEPVIKGIVKDLKKGISKSEVSLKFHNAICNMIKEVCILLRKKHKINKVCLSGGVFQNKYISGRIGPVLAESGFKAYLHDRIPAHDGGIALGQAVLAGA